MKTKLLSSPIQYLFPFLLALLCSAPAVPGATEHSDLKKTFSVAAGGQLAMEVDRGSIEIITGDRNDVVIEAKRSLKGESSSKAKEIFDEHDVSFTQDGDKVTVKARFKKEHNGWFNKAHQKLQVQYRVELPAKFNLDLQTAGGDIVCGDIEGQVKARTAGGSLRLAGIKGDCDVHTAGGDIRISEVTGKTKAKTSGGNIECGELGDEATAETAGGSISVKAAKSKLMVRTSGGNIELGTAEGPTEANTAGGSIRVKTVGGNLTAKTSAGNIEVDDARAAVVAQTAGGSVSVRFSHQPEEDCRLSTSAGDVKVKVAENLGFDVDASTSGGEVSTDVPVQSTVVGKRHNNSLKGKMNGGGKSLVLRTSGGDVHIQKL